MSRPVLAGYQPWYKTVVGTPDPSAEVQGTIYINGTSTDSYSLELRGVYEFKNPVNAGSTPALIREALLRRERERLMSILDPCAESSVAKTFPIPAPFDREQVRKGKKSGDRDIASSSLTGGQLRD